VRLIASYLDEVGWRSAIERADRLASDCINAASEKQCGPVAGGTTGPLRTPKADPDGETVSLSRGGRKEIGGSELFVLIAGGTYMSLR
jgi:hypothetical protein